VNFHPVLSNFMSNSIKTPRISEGKTAYHGLNFINVLHTAFTCADPECVKKRVKSAVSFDAFGTYELKSCAQNVDEIGL